MINGTEANAATIRTATAPSGTISVAKFEDFVGSSTPSFLRLMPQSWKRSGDARSDNRRIRNLSYQNFNIHERQNPNGFPIISPFAGTFYETEMVITVRSLQRRLFGIWWDNIRIRHSIGRSFQGTVSFGNAIRTPRVSLNDPQWAFVTINWNIGNANSELVYPDVTHTSNWYMPSITTPNNFIPRSNPAQSIGNVHRVNASILNTNVVRIQNNGTQTPASLSMTYPE